MACLTGECLFEEGLLLGQPPGPQQVHLNIAAAPTTDPVCRKCLNPILSTCHECYAELTSNSFS
jgi:hypothetical protein